MPSASLDSELGEIIAEYRYTWLSRHIFIKRLVFAALIGIVRGLVRLLIEGGDFPQVRWEAIFLVFGGTAIIGYVLDLIFTGSDLSKI